MNAFITGILEEFQCHLQISNHRNLKNTHKKKTTIKATKTLSIEWSKQPINEIIGSPTLALDTGQNFLKGSSKA